MASDRQRVSMNDRPGQWVITRGGIVVPSTATLHPGDTTYRVKVWTFCGLQEATIDVGCTQMMLASEFARRSRVIATIQHWLQNDCGECRELLRLATTPKEREWIHCSDPTLGPALGFGGGFAV